MTRRGARSTFARIHAEGRTPIGMFVTSTDPAITVMLAQTGYDFVLIDLEHSPMGPAEALAHIRAAEAGGIVALVRIPSIDRTLMQKVLDIGAEGLVISHIDTADDARAAVGATRYPPRGFRSVSPATHGGRYSGAAWPDYVAHGEAELVVVPILESIRAADNAQAICEVDGVDLVMFGAGDYSADRGVPPADPVVLAAAAEVRGTARAAGKQILSTSGLPGLQAGDVDVLAHHVDSLLISATFAAELARAKERFDRTDETETAGRGA